MTLSRRSLLGAALALPVLAACGDNAAEANGRKKVRLTYGAISVPKTRGVFEKTLNGQGIDVEWVGPFPNHAPTLQAVATNTADFSFGGSSTPADQALLSGNKLNPEKLAPIKARLQQARPASAPATAAPAPATAAPPAPAPTTPKK